MARTTDAEVRKIIEADDQITDMEPFITMANELTTECCGPDTDAGYTDVRLELIERLLAAHFYCLKDMRRREERAGSVSEHYDTKLDLGFNHTHHGQMALRMDTNGGLAALEEDTKEGGGISGAILWAGTSRAELES